MNAPGAPDPILVAARRALLDALDALGEQRDALILVGAQAVYLHTGSADIAVPDFTTDGDLVVVPADLVIAPLLGSALGQAGFSLSDQPGIWIREEPFGAGPFRAQIDLLVPEAVAGAGSRSADVGAHGKRTARRVLGLEGALVDHAQRRVAALDTADARAFDIRVAGPAALLVAKVHKISERVESDGRRKDKDALDVLRILRAIDTAELRDGLQRLLEAEIAAGGDGRSDRVLGPALSDRAVSRLANGSASSRSARGSGRDRAIVRRPHRRPSGRARRCPVDRPRAQESGRPDSA